MIKNKLEFLIKKSKYNYLVLEKIDYHNPLIQ